MLLETGLVVDFYFFYLKLLCIAPLLLCTFIILEPLATPASPYLSAPSDFFYYCI